MRIKIITDSSCDLPKHLVEQYDIGVAPLHVFIDGKDYTDGKDITHKEFYEKCSTAETLPKTSQPAPGDVLHMIQESLKEYTHVLSINLSSALSGTYQTVNMLKETIGEALTAFDTKNGSLGVGMQVLKACELVKEGLSKSEIIKRLTEYRESMDTLVYLETLENAVKGGRVSKFSYIAASMLNVKAIVYVDKEEGSVKVREKIRGEKKALRYIIDAIKNKNIDFSDRVIGITHADCLERANEFIEMLKAEVNPKEILLHSMGPVIGTYAARGAIYVCF
ncbi:DegV family protein with EDD domain [Anaerosolibacter carboniphilus]|uniref:DegV family protein with EDD domain n=1 Tax=Anaerosolibacter carboniphilus TaxID=1417629 RepID=A0A841KVB0_9FIRM|nr:DegV family protein [Anaerosolibacter carboniphilus]MBB6214129.1 DegV family protein with EDD domain [Anaerosolibacter carboniphilus]